MGEDIDVQHVGGDAGNGVRGLVSGNQIERGRNGSVFGRSLLGMAKKVCQWPVEVPATLMDATGGFAIWELAAALARGRTEGAGACRVREAWCNALASFIPSEGK